ncbi:aminotransferase class V-fold PLP-dependent enzyme [Cyclobacterium jeungdonense]|uniref:Cysteine desulfurase n=1 Tax=Cyclobacterium jeungdonense TaxID=708087 RepID=A0ABT8CAJ7_9BACT|nr:cysteine desulfurase [Cyclobacterium jeungdonense]MDN3689828.1 cysteine desulfurase [Cyclobacterium jeungdonense]
MQDLVGITDQKGKKLDLSLIRKKFPVLDQLVNGKPLAYFDNAATTQKPIQVIDALKSYYENDNSNIHRGAHTLASRATELFENTRNSLKSFINAPSAEEVIFTKGTTDSINLVAATFGKKYIKAGDEVIISTMEHHSNIVPWQMLCEENNAHLKIIPVSDSGELDLQAYKNLLSDKTKLVAVVHASNALGTINPVKTMIDLAHEQGARFLVDGAQSAAHLDVDVQELDCDFFTFSAHKMYGPTGVGVLYGKRELLESMPPYQGGGEMIREVTFAKTTYNDIPYKFEAGTPNIADVIAFNAALSFINELGKDAIRKQETKLLNHAFESCSAIKGFIPVGTASDKVSVLSFTINHMHAFDVGMMLDASGIAVRTGHHCTQPLMNRFGIEGTVRASFAVYNTIEEIDRFHESLTRIAKRKN